MTGLIQDVKIEYGIIEVENSNVDIIKKCHYQFWGEIITQKINVIRTSLPWQSGTKARGVPVWWLFIAGHLEETFHRLHITLSRPLSLFTYLPVLRAGRSGYRIPVRARFITPVQTGPGPTQPPIQCVPWHSRG
jgi:hypothetical protein